MTPEHYFKSHRRDVVEAVCKEAETTFSNFQQIALYGGSVSSRLAKRLEASSGEEMTVSEILFPDDHPGDTNTVAQPSVSCQAKRTKNVQTV